jgi:purine-binding chemotaxis protein CheW
VKNGRRSSGTEINWQEVHSRLAQATAATREVFAPSPERTEILLQERARRLAQPLVAERRDGDWLELLTFKLSGERYGIETRHVREVVRLPGLTAIPGAPQVVTGIANLRGQNLVVFDVRLLFGLTLETMRETSRVLVCGDATPDLGILVDAVQAVLRLPAHEIQADAVPAVNAAPKLVRGITRDATIILDGTALLADQRLFIGRSGRQ